MKQLCQKGNFLLVGYALKVGNDTVGLTPSFSSFGDYK